MRPSSVSDISYFSIAVRWWSPTPLHLLTTLQVVVVVPDTDRPMILMPFAGPGNGLPFLRPSVIPFANRQGKGGVEEEQGGGGGGAMCC